VPPRPVPPLHADARRRAAGAHAAHEQAVLGARGRDAEELPGELVGARGGEGAGGQADLLVAAVAPERQRDPVALGVVVDALLELLSRGHLAAVHLDERVAARDAGGLGGALGIELGRHHAAADAEVLRQLRGQVLDDEADPGVPHLAVGDQVLHHAPRAIDGDGEADALRLPVDGGVDADQLALDVEQRAARVPGVDRSVGLDEVGVSPVLVVQRAADRAHHAGGHRVREAEGVADRDHGLADHEIGRGPEGDVRQVAARLDAHDRDVGVGVRSHQRGVELALVGERHVDAARALDHVHVGHDGAVGRDDDARAEARRLEAPGARVDEVAEELLEERVLREGEGRAALLDDLLGRDVHHRRARLLDRLDHQAPPRRVALRPARRRDGGEGEGRDH